LPFPDVGDRANSSAPAWVIPAPLAPKKRAAPKKTTNGQRKPRERAPAAKKTSKRKTEHKGHTMAKKAKKKKSLAKRVVGTAKSGAKMAKTAVDKVAPKKN
jgi:hypothetical protein